MKQKKIVPVWLSVVLVILSVAEILLEGFQIFNATAAWWAVQPCLFGLCAVLALVYCFLGYKKSAATFFFVFCISAAVSKAVSLICSFIMFHQVPIVHTALWLIAFVCLLILMAVKNLGKKKSYTLAGIVLGCELAVFLSIVFLDRPFDVVLSSFAQVVNALIFGVMVYAKYQDKAARGTK